MPAVDRASLGARRCAGHHDDHVKCLYMPLMTYGVIGSNDGVKNYICNNYEISWYCFLTHWGRVRHICIGKLTIIGSDNGLSPGRRQAIIWTNAGILLIGPLGTCCEILIVIDTFSFKKMHLKMASAKSRPFCLSLGVLTDRYCWHFAYCLWDELHLFATKFLHQYIVVISICYLRYNLAW